MFVIIIAIIIVFIIIITIIMIAIIIITIITIDITQYSNVFRGPISFFEAQFIFFPEYKYYKFFIRFCIL